MVRSESSPDAETPALLGTRSSGADALCDRSAEPAHLRFHHPHRPTRLQPIVERSWRPRAEPELTAR